MTVLERMFVIAAVLAVPATALAQSTVSVRPPELAVAPWDTSAEARVILHNKEKTAITGATLTVFSNDGITATIDPAPAPRLEPNDSFAWRIPLNVSAARVPGTLELDVAFTVDGRRRHLFDALKLKGAEGAVVDKPLEVTLTGSFDAVSESRPGRGYVVVANSLDVPATVTAIRVQTSDPDSFLEEPDFNEASTNTSTKFVAFDVPARSSRSQFIELRAAPSIQSGKHRIVLAVDAEWKRHGQPQRRTLLLGQDVTLGVFFETEVLKAISVPSFLLLPGCLFLLTINVLLKFNWGGPNKPTQWPKLEPMTADFGVLAVTWSGIFAWLYAIWPGVDLLSRYGAADLRNVWLSSIALGAVLYAGMVEFNRRRNKNRPAATDDAMATLAKMGHRGVKLRVPKADVTIKNETLQAFVVDDTNAEVVWVVPPIEVKWGTDGGTLPAKQAIIGLINTGTAAELVTALKATDGWKTIDFNADGSLPRPAWFAETAIKPGGAEPMVKVI